MGVGVISPRRGIGVSTVFQTSITIGMSDAQNIDVMNASFTRHLILSAALAVGMGATAEAALFDAPVNLPGTTLGEAVATADFDNDGWMDAVVATSSNTADVLYRNNGNGTFTTAEVFSDRQFNISTKARFSAGTRASGRARRSAQVLWSASRFAASF